MISPLPFGNMNGDSVGTSQTSPTRVPDARDSALKSRFEGVLQFALDPTTQVYRTPRQLPAHFKASVIPLPGSVLGLP